MHSPEDNVLLERYAKDRSDEAFSVLVKRHVNLVYSAALRHVGNPHHAEEITQAVFFILARKAGSLSSSVILSGWLYRTTRLTAANFLRQENRRKIREQEAYMQSIVHDPEPEAWRQVAPELESAMEQLPGSDHDAVVLRFFEGRNFRDVGERLGLSEDAAKKRVGRAVEKLRKFFTKRGIALSAVALSTVLSTNSVHAAPAGLAVSISTAKLAGGGVLTVSTLALIKSTLNIMTWLKVKTAALVTIAVVLTATMGTIAVTKVQQIAFPARTADDSLPAGGGSNPTPSQPKVAAKPAAHALPDLKTILAETDDFEQTKELVAYIDTLSPAQIPDVLRQIHKAGGDRNFRALQLLSSYWAAIDPKAMETELASNTDKQLNLYMISSYYNVRALKDPAGAFAQAKQVPTKTERDQALSVVISTLASSDPTQALAMYQEVKDDPYHSRARSLFGALADKDPNQALQAAQQLSDPEMQQSALDAIADALMAKEPRAAFDWLNQLPAGKLRDRMQADLVSNWNNDIPALTAYLQGIPPSPNKADLIKSAAQQLTADHPEAAVTLLKSLPPSSQTDEAVAAVVRDWSKNDPKAAGEFVKTLPQDPEHAQSFMQVAFRMQEKDPAAALAWTGQLTDGWAKNETYRQVFSEWAVRDSLHASAYVGTMPAGQERQNAVASVVRGWSSADPAAAAQWLTTISNGQQNDVAYETLIGTWAPKDPAQASAWLAQQPSGSSRDAAVKSFSSSTVVSDPGGAFQWAESIGDSKVRQDSVTAVLKQWMRTDSTAASAALSKSSLPDDVKNQILAAKK